MGSHQPIPAISLLVLAATSAQAQERSPADTTVYRIEGIRVTAERPVATVGGASAFEVRLDSMRLGVSPAVEDVLRALPTVHVRTNTRGEAELSIRGSESRQVAVLVDGVPLTLGWDARTDVSVLPAAAVREISLVRGLSSVLHGPNVLGGVVEMSIGRGTDLPAASALQVSSALDNVGGYAASASGSVPVRTLRGGWLFRAGAGLRDSPGATLARGISEPVPTDRSLRLNTDLTAVDGFMAARYRANGGGWFSFSGSSFLAERGIAGELGVEQPRLWRYPHLSRAIVTVSGGTGERGTPFGRGDLEASLGIDVGRSETRSYASRTYQDVTGREDGDDRTVTLRLLGDHTLGSRADLRAAFTYSNIHHEATVAGRSSDYQQELMSLGSETVWNVWNAAGRFIESLRFSVGAAYDHGVTPKTGGLPALGALHDWGVRAGLSALVYDGNAIIHAGASRRGRFPALREMYSEALDRFLPNPDLRLEHLLAFEAGVTMRLGQGDVQIVSFHHRLSDAIRRVTLPNGKRQRVNSEQIRSAGAEVLVSQAWGPLAVGGDLTLQSVRLIDPVTTVSREPENLPGVSGGVHARLPLAAGFTAAAEARHTGTQFCQHPDSGADVRLEDGTVLGGDVSRTWTLSGQGRLAHLETRLSVDNLADTPLYDQCGLPRGGRLFRFQIRLF